MLNTIIINLHYIFLHFTRLILGNFIIEYVSIEHLQYTECVIYTVKPLISGYPWDQKKWPHKRGVRLWEVKNVVFVCS